MKSLLKIFGFLIFASFAFFGFANGAQARNCDATPNVNTNTSHECVYMKGYAWGADNSPFGGVGWINFNNTSSGSNTSSGVDYYVEFDRTDKTLHGYAYSERYGYIKFGGFEEISNGKSYPSAGSCKGGSASDANCNAQLVSVNAGYQLVGYARFCFVYQSGCSGNVRSSTELGGYDGWIAFSGSNISVSYGTSNNAFSGYAWGGGSSTQTNSNYASGAGWIKMNPTNGGVSCKVPAGGDCLDDKDQPSLTLTASPNPAAYNQNVTLTWTVSNIANGCTTATSSTPSNSTWDNYTVTGTGATGNPATVITGNKNIGTISKTTTFTLSCTYNGKKATVDAQVDLKSYTPQVTLSAPASKIYGESAQLDYTVTNIPYGCTGALYRNGTAVSGYDNISVTGDGTETYTNSNSITITNNTVTSDWEFKCTDSTPPSPARVGSATAKTTITVPTPQVTFAVKSTDTNSTTIIPCTNNGVTISYSTKDVKSGSCKATVDYVGTDPDWGSGTSITENDGPTVHDVTTGSVTKTGNIIYSLQCKKLDGTPWTAGKVLSRSCSAGSLAVTAAASCVEPSQMVDINYVGSNLTSGSCKRSWVSGSSSNINQSNFNLHYQRAASTLTVGQTYTYTVSDCVESSYPNNTPLTASVNVSVQNSCSGSTTTTGGVPKISPKFKEF